MLLKEIARNSHSLNKSFFGSENKKSFNMNVENANVNAIQI